MNGRRWVWLVVLGVIGVVAAGCATMMAEKPTLYERLGGKEEIHKLVDDFVARVAADPMLKARFNFKESARTKALVKAGVPPPLAELQAVGTLKTYLTEQICEAAGGPCSYVGKNMKAAHAGMGISGAEFDAVVKHLIASLDKFKVPAAEKDELLALLGPLKKEIVEKP
jgi:hemoglobin